VRAYGIFEDLRGQLVTAFQTIPLSTVDCEGSVSGMD